MIIQFKTTTNRDTLSAFMKNTLNKITATFPILRKYKKSLSIENKEFTTEMLTTDAFTNKSVVL